MIAQADRQHAAGKTQTSFVRVAFAVFFLLTASLPLLFLAAGIDSPRFASEARPAVPSVMVNGTFNPGVTAEFDAYWSRSFPASSFLVSRYNWLTGHVFGSSANEQVIWGDDGYLFFKETLRDMLHISALSDSDLKKINTSLRLQQQHAETLGARFYFALAPNKASIYPEKLPACVKPAHVHSQAERMLGSADAKTVIDLFAPLRHAAGEQAAGASLYHRLDSHWNFLGAYNAYRTLFQAMGLEPLKINGPYERTADFQGDLATMFYPDRKTFDANYAAADFEPDFIWLRPIRTLEDITIETRQRGKSGRLVMFRDSFANALLPFISSSLGEVTYMRQSQPDFRVVATKQPDLVLYEIAERNLDWLLQATPIMPAPAESEPAAAAAAAFVPVLEMKEAFGLFHTQANLDAADLSFSRVLVSSAGSTYEAFPVYEDGIVDDGTFRSGFSLYTVKPLPADEPLAVYLLTEAGWVRLQNEP